MSAPPTGVRARIPHVRLSEHDRRHRGNRGSGLLLRYGDGSWWHRAALAQWHDHLAGAQMALARKAMNWRMSETSAADSSLQGSRQAVTPLARASSGKTGERMAPWIGSILFPLTLYIAGFLVFFRWQILSNFDLVFGDRGDARLVAFLHEHVYRWLYVRSGLLSPPFFFDQTKTLGYSDAFPLGSGHLRPPAAPWGPTRCLRLR